MLMRLDQREAATACFVESVKQKPYNWSCWSQMAQLVKSADMVCLPFNLSGNNGILGVDVEI